MESEQRGEVFYKYEGKGRGLPASLREWGVYCF